MLKRQEENAINKQKNSIRFGDIVIDVVQWFSFERAVGLALLFTAGLYAIEPLRDRTTISYIAQSMQVDTTLVGLWYTLGGAYLFFKHKISAIALVACVFPVFLTTTAHLFNIFFTHSGATVDNISSEFIVTILIMQKVIRKATVEFLEKIK